MEEEKFDVVVTGNTEEKKPVAGVEKPVAGAINAPIVGVMPAIGAVKPEDWFVKPTVGLE